MLVASRWPSSSCTGYMRAGGALRQCSSLHGSRYELVERGVWGSLDSASTRPWYDVGVASFRSCSREDIKIKRQLLPRWGLAGRCRTRAGRQLRVKQQRMDPGVLPIIRHCGGRREPVLVPFVTFG